MGQRSDYSVVFCDDDIVVVNKKSGLCVAADRFNPEAPRLDLLAQKEFGTLLAVHRIDKDTSGLVVYARNAVAHKGLCEQFQSQAVEKVYHCIVNGRPSWNVLTVTLPLLPDGDGRHRTVVNKRDGKKSRTDFVLLATCGQYSWIEARPRTGRTHQIRAHLKANSIGIVCDELYWGIQKGIYLSEVKRAYKGKTDEERPLISRLALHAYKIGFAHPIKKVPIELAAPYPRDMEAVRKQFLKLYGGDPLAPKMAR